MHDRKSEFLIHIVLSMVTWTKSTTLESINNAILLSIIIFYFAINIVMIFECFIKNSDIFYY